MKILLLDRPHRVLVDRLTQLGCECHADFRSNKSEVEKILPEFQGIVMRSRLTLDNNFIDHGVNLKFIAREGVGVEHIPVEYAESRGIRVLRSPEGSRDTVGEHAVGMLLMLMNNLNRADQQVRNGEWLREPNRGVELMGKTVGIIGYGNMGTSFAKRLSGFGVKTLAYDKFKENYGDEFAEQASLQMVWDEAEVVSLHFPYSVENEHFVNDVFLSNFKNDIFLVNTARGLVLNTADLVKHLKSGHVRGAALDVLEYEEQSFDRFRLDTLPEPFDYLKNAPNVVLAPHIAGWSFESKKKHGEVLAEKIERLFFSV